MRAGLAVGLSEKRIAPNSARVPVQPVERAVDDSDGQRQNSERKRAVARVSLRWSLPDVAYAACGTAHTSPHRSWKRHR